MSAATPTMPPATAAAAIPLSNGRETHFAPTPVVARYNAQSTISEVPGDSINFPDGNTGEQLGKLFSERPDLPGVILFDQGRYVGVISQTQFYKCVSRAFGREIYYRRSARIMLQEVKDSSLVLPSDCPIPKAVDICLARPLDLLYEPFLVHDKESENYRLCSMQDLLLASSQIAALRNRQMEQILNTVTDGLLVIDRQYRIGGEHSKAVSKIFERPNFHHLTLLDVLKPLIDPVAFEQIAEYLKILFDPKLIDRLIKSINPAKEVSAVFTSPSSAQFQHTKHFAFHFERIRTQSEISQILVRVEDITQTINHARELKRQEAAAEEKLQIVMQVLQVEPSALQRFMSRLNEEVASLARQAGQPDALHQRAEWVHPFFRQVHTLKGEAGQLRLATFERHLHHVEDHLDKIRSAPSTQAVDPAPLKLALEGLQKLEDQIRQALDQLKYLQTPARAASSPAAPPKPIGPVEMLNQLISDLSRKLNKPTRFHTSVHDEDLPDQYRDLLGEALMHLARNSMVHGIENARDRAASGKDPEAMIQLELKTHPEMYEVIFQDDGAGLSYAKIRRRAEKLGWNLSTEEELRNAIFEPGFSTADQVTELAGRGVGLDIIRNALVKAGGIIVPYSQEGAYCAFQIILPKTP